MKVCRLVRVVALLGLSTCGPVTRAAPPPSTRTATPVASGEAPSPAAARDGAAPAQPPPAPPIQNVYGRKVRSLAGAWRAIVDPYDNGYYDYHGAPHAVDGYFANRKPASKSDRVEYDFDRSETLAVPGDWNSQRRELFLYEGAVWYKADLDAKPAADRRLFVHFGAANYEAQVFVDGKELGEHAGGFTPFDVELTGALRGAGDFIVVRVNNRRRRDGVPALNTDWWNYGGLTRDVLLVDVPATFVRDYELGLASGDAPGRRASHALSGWVQLDGPRAEQDVTVQIPEAGASARVRTDARGFARFDMTAAVDLWSPERPKLYAVQIRAETDQVDDRVGFRSIRTRGADILLNGAPVFLRGISLHEQAPMREGRAFSADDARTLLGWARQLGANFVRLAHYPHNEHMLRMADEMGLLVWAEIPVYWTIDWENPATLAAAEAQLTEMISRDKNRASVGFWSLGNETPRGPGRERFMGALVVTARRLDPSRLLTAALEQREIDPHTRTIDDPLGAELDVLGCNEYVGWYDGLPDKADGLEWTTPYAKPLVMSEFGADALQGMHGDALTRWTEEYQASVYAHQIRMLERIPFLRGVTPWILTDFRSPRRALPGIEDYWNRKGLISEHGQKKQAFFVLQQYYERLARAAASAR
ncbi:MAG TPA: glycoside hydrolase family 2 TIM barrel-domain containing protein [Polyangiaceae bacterium]|nr:glycoside hydrolase family 2 TIM barrel-domain containing protein [Polyangiaceae bacterium]